MKNILRGPNTFVRGGGKNIAYEIGYTVNSLEIQKILRKQIAASAGEAPCLRRT